MVAPWKMIFKSELHFGRSVAKGFWCPWTFPASPAPPQKLCTDVYLNQMAAAETFPRITGRVASDVIFLNDSLLTKNSYLKWIISFWLFRLSLVPTTPHRPGCHKHHPIGHRFLPSLSAVMQSLWMERSILSNDSKMILSQCCRTHHWVLVHQLEQSSLIFTQLMVQRFFFFAPRVPLRQWNQIWSHRAVWVFSFGTVWLR